MRRYLAEFLSDPLVVRLPRFVWLPILYGIVLRTRPAKSAEKYRLIWTAEGSPLRVHTQRQARLLGCDFAMRYGDPGLRQALERKKPAVVLPLYPQYSESTTGSVLAIVPPGTRVVKGFHDHPAYIDALAASIKPHLKAKLLLMSFHGLPQREVDRGDPYQRQCLETARLLGEKLGVEYKVTFQSRFGAAKWLQPYTEPTLVELAQSGVREVDVVCPGFVSDCLETLEEIDIGARAAFRAAGGKTFNYIPCLNESPQWIAALKEIANGVPAFAGTTARS